MFRLALLLSCSLSLNCTVLTDVLSTDLGDASTGAGDAEPPNVLDASGDAMDSAIECPQEYEEVAGTCHLIVENATTWLLAEADCELDGAHLVIIDDEAEEAVVPDGSWIGLYEWDANGNFLTVTNQTPPLLNWASGNPADGPGLCVDKRAEGWHDDNCVLLKPYVCEFDGVAADTPYL